MKIKWNKQTIIVIVEYIIALMAIYFISVYYMSDIVVQNDVFFDLKTGESILKYGIDFKDHFSWIPNLTYTYHHWLYDVIFYLLYKKYDFAMIKYLYLLLTYILGLIIFHTNRVFSKSRFFACIVTVFTIFLANHFIQSRVQTITYGLLILEYLLIEQLYKDGKKWRIIPLLIIGIIIANIHMPIWILTLVFFLPFLAETILYYVANFWNKKNKWEIEKPKSWITLVVAFVLLALTGLLTPLKFYPYTFFLQCMNNTTYTFINEMQQTALITYKNVVYTMIAGLVLLYFKIIKLKPRDFFLIVGIFMMSLMARRHVAYMAFFLPTILLKSMNWELINEFLKELYKKWKYLTRKWKWLKKVRKQRIIDKYDFYMLLLLIPIILLPFKIDKYQKQFSYCDIPFKIKVNYPYDLVKYIKENVDLKDKKIHNGFNFGSYLEFYDIPVFIDSRAEVYMKEYNGGYDIINEYLNSKKYKTYKSVFDKYKFDYVIVEKSDELYKILENDEDYENVTQESYYTLYKRIEKE